jgi:hypothetical protein
MRETMDENLVGYVLNALDPETQREVEDYLRSRPDAMKNLELIRQAFEPLAADQDAYEPPAGLRVRTLAHVAEYRCQERHTVPPAPPYQSMPHVSPSWWRRADVLVAASLLLIGFPLLLPWIARMQHKRNIVECQDNLRRFYTALVAYSENHSGELPQVKEEAPQNFAGVFVPILNQDGLLGQDVSIQCASRGRTPPAQITLQQLQQLYQALPRAEFERHVRELGGCYAYPLGYRIGGKLVGLRYEPGRENNDLIPIMADRPPFDQPGPSMLANTNSENHGGQGQNVLRLGGTVEFCTTRMVGIGGSDIYLNRNGQLDAGVDSHDIVLGASAARPRPSENLEP